MSAFIVSDAHVTALAAYACRDMQDYGWAMTIQEIGEMFNRENVASVNHRYSDHDPEPCTFKVHVPTLRRKFTMVEIIKACHCLRYQSCEHDGWETSKACQILKSIVAHATNRLPGYDEAEWVISDSVAESREYAKTVASLKERRNSA